MKYFTRELYTAYQGSSVDSKRQEKKWRSASINYLNYLEEVRPLLPKGMQEISKNIFHDAVVKSFTRTKNNLAIVLDGRSEFYLSDRIRIIFKGVKRVKGLDKLVNGWWCYEEVHLIKKGEFEYCVLLHKSDFSITAADAILIESGMLA